MKPRIENLVIERFRALRKLEIKGMGRVNLITGRNNTGKSTVLEALRILASNGPQFIVRDILNSREEYFDDIREQSSSIDSQDVFQLTNLFQGFPDLSNTIKPIVIKFSGSQSPRRLSIGMDWFSEGGNHDEHGKPIPQQSGSFGEEGASLALVFSVNDSPTVIPLNQFSIRVPLGHRLLKIPEDKSSFPCQYVSSFGGERTTTLGSLWDGIALSDCEHNVVEALQIIDPEVIGVSMIGGEGRKPRTAIVRTSSIPRPIPLRSFGDGMNRLFSIILSLVNAKDGIFLIDEFENGMHHTVQAKAWTIIFNLARRLNVQVIATSHSWDAIEAFQKVANKDCQGGVLIRLSRKGEDTLPTVFREDELAIATRDRIEVR